MPNAEIGMTSHDLSLQQIVFRFDYLCASESSFEPPMVSKSMKKSSIENCARLESSVWMKI